MLTEKANITMNEESAKLLEGFLRNNEHMEGTSVHELESDMSEEDLDTLGFNYFHTEDTDILLVFSKSATDGMDLSELNTKTKTLKTASFTLEELTL